MTQTKKEPTSNWRDQQINMNGIYDHEKLCLHKKKSIPMMIKVGQLAQKLIKEIPTHLLKKACASLKVQYRDGHRNAVNTQEKQRYVLDLLDRIVCGKFDLVKKYIDLGQQFNDFYEGVNIPLPTQVKDFICTHCNERAFTTNASLHSHLRSCPKNKLQNQNEEYSQRKTGFKKVKTDKNSQYQPRVKKVNVQIVYRPKQNLEKGNEKIKLEQNVELKREYKEESLKRQRPMSSFSLGSQIFYGDD